MIFYFIVLGMVIVGMNVMLVLIIGIFISGVIGIVIGSFGFFDWFGVMGMGIIGMGELIIIILLVGGMFEMICYNGGIDFIICKLICYVNGKWGVEFSIVVLVSIVNFCMVNNMIVIIIIGLIVKDIVKKF